MTTVFGILPTKKEANSLVKDLNEFGYRDSDVSVVMKEDMHKEDDYSTRGENTAGGAVTGATSGAVIGGLGGLLVGIGAITIPGLGAILVAGPIAAALGLTGAAATTVTGAALGGLTGGLVGGLIGLGLPEEDAQEYEDRVKEGKILVAAPVRREEEEGKVERMFELHGAENVRAVSTSN